MPMSVRTLAVGTMDAWDGDVLEKLAKRDLKFVSLDEMVLSLMDRMKPEMVLSPVLERDFDCIDVAMRLASLQFTGLYRVVALQLPRPKLVETEIAQYCPNLHFDVVSDI